MSHVTHLNESSNMNEWVMTRKKACRGKQAKRYWFVSHIQMSQTMGRVPHTNESDKGSCHTYKWVRQWVMSHIQMSPCMPSCVSWLIRMQGEARKKDTYIYIYVSLCILPASSCICLLHNQTHIQVFCVTHIYIWVMFPMWMSTWMSHVTRINEIWKKLKQAEREWVMSHILMSHVTHTNDSCHIYKRVMSHR